jgi:hypothetical protein
VDEAWRVRDEFYKPGFHGLRACGRPVYRSGRSASINDVRVGMMPKKKRPHTDATVSHIPATVDDIMAAWYGDLRRQLKIKARGRGGYRTRRNGR